MFFGASVYVTPPHSSVVQKVDDPKLSSKTEKILAKI